MSDEQPWQTKSQIMVTLGKSSRTVDLWVRAGKIERMQDGARAFFRLATPGNGVTPRNDPPAPPELQQILLEMRDELRALRAEVAALRALPPAELPAATPSNPVTPGALPEGNASLPGNARRSWWRRLLYGPEGAR